MLVGNSRVACGSKIASLNLIEIRHIFPAFFPQKKASCFELERKAHGMTVLNIHRTY